MKFAAFIITYERPVEVLRMVERLFSQTAAPEKILVVDNSASHKVRECLDQLGEKRVSYLRMGYNSGPAGAAHAGLRELTSQGYDWIYWGDDNDPPRTPDSFERLFTLISREERTSVGMVGLMGNTFDLHRAKIRVPDLNELRGTLSVNSLAGGSTMLINANVVRSGILPDPDLFFGFEELDFCLRVVSGGYAILIDGDFYRQAKEQSTKQKLARTERIGFNSRQKSLWREYYSIRNLLIIVWYRHRSVLGLVLLVSRVGAKIVFSYTRGISFGVRYSRAAGTAMLDFWRNKKGRTIEPFSM